MANLFFIHTPFQLLVAQQIIRQDQLRDNVMLYGYVDDNVHFLKLYEMTIIDSMWSERVAMPEVARWALMSRKHLWRDCWRTWYCYKFLRDVICKHHVDVLFLGDMKNYSCQLTALTFHRKGLKICFFEEGCGHYVMNYDYGLGGGFIDKVYAILIDAFYYRPLYGVSMGFICYWKGFVLSDLPMDIRYSLVPFYHESFDRQIYYEPLISGRLKAFLVEETSHLTLQSGTLLLTSPYYLYGVDSDRHSYVKTIIDYAKSNCKQRVLHIKFHPRESQEIRQIILEQLNKEGIDYLLLGTKMNIPVEYYLQYIHYEQIVMFLCSTSFYNGYLFPKTEFVSLLRNYYENCKEAGSANAKYLEILLSTTCL